MLNSKLYKKYFPLKVGNTNFSNDEKKILSRWISSFREEVRIRELSKIERGLKYITYNLEGFEEKVMIDMLNKNKFNDMYLAILNIIIYRHKYNAILSCYVFPILKCKKKKEE